MKMKKDIYSSIQYFGEDIVLLEDIYRGGQAEVRVGYNQKTNQMLVVKHFLSVDANEDYIRERNMYQYLKQNGCGDLVLNLLEYNDKENILIIERGICDLQTFVKLRRKSSHPDGPLKPAEVLLVMEYVATAMQRLWNDAKLCLCDTKEQNILIVYSAQGFGGYRPILTDLGAAYCQKVDPDATYPVALTARYFDPVVLQKIYENKINNNIRNQQSQRNNGEIETSLIIYSEIYTLGRTVQSLLSYCLPESEEVQFKLLTKMFKEQDKILEYLALFQDSARKLNEYPEFQLLTELTMNILVAKKYSNYSSLIQDIQDIKNQIYQVAGKKVKVVEFLSDSSDSAKQWQKQLIEQKSGFNSQTLQALEQQSRYYHERDLFSNSIVINKKIIERLDQDLKKFQKGQQNNFDPEIKKLLISKCQALKYLAYALKKTGDSEKTLKCNEQELQIRVDLLKECESEEIAYCYGEIGSNNRILGKLNRAIEFLQISLRIRIQLYGEDNFNLASTYGSIGNVYYQQGNLEQSLEMQIKCLNIMKAHYGDNNVNLAYTYGNIGIVYKQQGNLEQALEMQIKCLNIEKAHYGDNNFNLASTYNNIGEVYRQQGNLEQALEIHMKSLNIKKTHYGDNNFNLASTYNNIGEVYRQQGNLEQALEIHMKSLNIKKTHYGDNNFNLASTYNNIGEVYRQQGNLEQALEMYMKSLNIMKAHYADNNFNLAITYGNIGLVYGDQGNLEQALEMYMKSLNIMKAHYGDNNFNLASTYGNIGNVYKEQDNLEQALEMYMKCLNIMKAHYGDNNFNLASTYGNIGSVYNDQGRLEQALEMYMKCLNIMKEHYGDNNFYLANTYGNIGNVYNQQGNLEQALEMYMECLNIQKANYGDNNFNLGITYQNLSLLFKTMKNLQESSEMSQKAYNIFKNHYGDNHQSTQKAKQQCNELKEYLKK